MPTPPLPRVVRALILALGIILFFAGCQTSSSPLKRGPHSPEQASAIRHALIGALKFGMRESQIRSWLGQPKSIQPNSDDPIQEEWVYENALPVKYRTIAIEIELVPWVDPITGEMRMIEQPLIGQQRIDGTEILTLTFREGTLRKIDRTLDERPTYSR